MHQPSRIVILAALGLSGCASQHVVPASAQLCEGICSEGSGYAPVARLFASTRRTADSLSVVIDSGEIAVSSLQPSAPGPVLMVRLSFRAFVASQAPEGRTATDSIERAASLRRGHAWRREAESAKQPLADSLRLGEVRTIAPTRFDMLLPQGLPSDAWFGFEITGDAIDPRVEASKRRTMVNGVRVYVCDSRTLGGALDSTRARKLAQHYSETC